MTAFTRIARAVLAAMILMLGGAVPALSETAGATERSELPVVTLATAEKTPIEARVPVSGSLVARQPVQIHANVSGYEIQGVIADVGDRVKKGDVLAVARIAGIMGAKNNSMLIPLCHAIAMTKCDVEFELDEKNSSIKAICTTACVGKTGVEMEAMTGVSVALLTIYDMCKALDRGMELGQIHLLEKSGGKSGHYTAE